MTDIITATEERRTIVFFDTARDIGDDQVTELVRLATKAPTSFNLQNWRFAGEPARATAV